ncbi:MAG: SDR family NAD(P)-dependent oxidoreductase [Asgard group archaeon]|nr:SDR family NAD(P)-dependent oxidoreductase [Asgard group archaeon]
MISTMSKDKKYVLVTGAANGIGLATTQYLASKGDFVIATDKHKEALEQLQGKENIIPIFMDVTNNDSISKAITEIEKITDGLDVLVNNAGCFHGGPLVEFSEEEMIEIFNVNVFGVHKVTKQFFPLLLKNKGTIINVGSETGRVAWPINGPYSMTKYALEAFSDSLRRELMFLGMKVVHLQVGAMDTNFLDRTLYCYSDCIDIEQTLFPNLVGSVVDACKGERGKASDPIVVGKKIHKIINKKRPKSRYRIKNDRLRRMTEFLPSSLLDKSLKMMFK